MTNAGYTPTERNRIVDLIQKLPGEFFNGRDWESVVSDLYGIIQGRRARQLYSDDPRITHTHDDRQAKPL